MFFFFCFFTSFPLAVLPLPVAILLDSRVEKQEVFLQKEGRKQGGGPWRVSLSGHVG